MTRAQETTMTKVHYELTTRGEVVWDFAEFQSVEAARVWIADMDKVYGPVFRVVGPFVLLGGR
jgi:hypothetical protein